MTFSSQFNSTLGSDTVAIQSYINAVNNGSTTTQAFEMHMRGASTAAQTYVQSMNFATLSTDAYVQQAKMAEIATMAQNKSFTSVRSILNTYNTGLSEVGLSSQQFIQSVAQANSVLGRYLANVGVGNATMRGYVGTLIAAKAATIGLRIAQTALNAVIGFGLGLVVQFVMSGIAKAFEAIKDACKSTEEKMSDLNTKFQEISSKAQETAKNFQQLKSSVADIAPRFAELSKGVDSFGNNISLTDEEYTEFLKLNNEIAEMFPELNMGFDSNGNAMLALTGSADTLEQSLLDLVEAQRKLANEEIAKQIPDQIDALKDYDELSEKTLKDYQDRLEAYQEAKDDLEQRHSQEAIDGAKKMYGDDWQSEMLLNDQNSTFSVTAQSIWGYSEEDKAAWRAMIDDFVSEDGLTIDWYKLLNSQEFQNRISGMEKYINDFEQKSKDKWKSLASYMNSWVQTDDIYNTLDDQMQKVVSQMVSNLEYGTDELDESEEIKKYIKDNILTPLQNASPEIKQAFYDMFSIGTDDKSTTEYIKKIEEKAKEIADNSDFTYEEVLKNTGFEEIIGKYEGYAKDIVKSLDGVTTDMVYALSPDDVARAFDYIKDYGISSWDELITALENNTFETVMDFSVESEGMDNLFTAMKESVASTGLTADSISKLKARYKELEDYDAASLFEKTANGIHLNTKELRELESAYEKQQKQAIDNKLSGLGEQYENLTEQIKNCDDTVKVADLYAKRQNILDQIDDTATLAAQYDGLTSSFKKWEEAQSLGEEGDMYDSLQGGLEHIKELYDEGLIGTNEFRAAVQLMSNEDLSTASIDELIAAYDKGYEKMTRYFTESSDGCLNFLNDVSRLNSEWVKLNDDGSWDINFGVGDDADVAEKLGLDVETVQAIMRKLSDYGFDINLDSIFTKLDYLQDELTTATEKLKELGLTKTEFDFDTDSIEDVNSQIDEAQKLVDGFKDKKGKIDLSVDGAMEAETVLIGLMNRKQELSAPTVMHVDVSEANDDITNLIGYLKDYQTNYNDIELKTAIGADTSEAETNIGETLTKINEIPKEVKTKLGLDDKDFTDAVSNIQADVKAGVSPKQEDLDTVQKTISEISPEMMVEAGLDSSRIDNYEPKDKTAFVEYTSPSGQAITDYQNSIDKWQPQNKTATITYNPVVNSLGGSITSWISSLFGSGKANGTAITTGIAKAKGDWSTKEDGEALGGELGQEMVVRDGRFFTIGDNGAEFFKYKKGDIIFNAEQTRQILKNGKITSGKKRGTALAEGTAFSGGSGKITAKGSVITTPSGSNNSDNSNSKDSSNDSTQTIDYVEIAIDRVQRAVNKLKKVAESAFKSLKKRLNATSDEIEKINEQIAVQNTAYSTYMAKANSINLSSSIKQAVRNGSYSITDYDSDTASLINEYKQYYEAALDCKEAVQDLNDELAQLYKDKFDLIEQDFDNQLSRMENKANRIESKISLLEAQNYFVSSKYYKKLANQEQDNIAMLNDKYAGLQEALDEAVNSGKISKYSEEWYNMTIAIEDTKAAIDDATVSLAEYEDKMREIDWSVFDYLQDRISQINSESDFLIDLMSNSDMFDDVGNFTDKGLATAGLHGVNYNTYMAQADKYAKELISIQNQLADDPADTRLIERKEELLELQQQSIKNAEEEKQAIKSLVEDGIKVQLDSLQDLIDTYTDSLDKAKSFYDYQNKIEDKTSAIAEIQKQLTAYENNVSEETQAKVQKLKIDLVDAQKELAETEYEQYISDTKQLLDTLYDEYETILNERLDNIDMLMEDMIDTINLNSGDISATLRETGESVGYTLTNNMTDIWSSGITSSNNVISMYGDNFSNTLTSLNETLNNIAAGVDIITGGRSSSKKTTTTQPTKTANTTNTKSNNTKTNSNNSNTKQGNGKGEIGDKVTYTSGIYYENSAGGGRWGNQYLGKSVYITSKNPGSAYPYHISTGKTLGNGDLGWVKLNQLKGYKTGGLVDYTGLAQLDGTPDKPELVLNAQDTENFVSLRDTLRKMSEQPLSVWGNNVYSSFGTPPITAFPFKNFEKKIAELGTPTQSINQNNEINITIPIDHVQDYNEMLEQMKKDSKFENMIKAIGITPLTGGSSLAKNNIYWN